MNNYSGRETVNAGAGKELAIKAFTEIVVKVWVIRAALSRIALDKTARHASCSTFSMLDKQDGTLIRHILNTGRRL